MTPARLPALRGALVALLLPVAASLAQRGRECSSCADWNQPQRPIRLHGNSYYVGTRGLGAILITSPAGHVRPRFPPSRINESKRL